MWNLYAIRAAQVPNSDCENLNLGLRLYLNTFDTFVNETFFLEECEMCVLILVVVFSQGLEAPAPQALTSVIRESTRRPV